MQRFAAKYKKKIHFTSEVLNALTGYNWPGNVRELQNMVQSLVITKDPPLISLGDLPRHILGDSAGGEYGASCLQPMPLKEIVASVEREILENAIKKHGSINKVAQLYQVDRTTIFRKLKYGQSLGEPGKQAVARKRDE